ncbi:MAG: S1 RNA-binding domain-containing protein [Lachnospiraceae bacterium]|jgi:small subunit ribosomal protein S1|nr:S1 RNA-binding domain-containing protein [Lachnospiraceae bacterium]
MNEELKAVVETAAPEQAAAEAPAPAETVAQEPEAAAETQAEAQEPVESMADYAKELEASYKAFDERHFEQVPEEEGPEAEKWAELRQMMEDKTVIKVKIKEAVKAGVTAYVDEIQAFIPASQISTQYVEKLEDWVGKHIEVVPITVDSQKKRLVLSGRVVQKEREAAEKAAKMAAIKAGSVLEGEVESLKDYGAFVKLDAGVTGLLHVSQISRQRIKHPGVVLKEGQRITVKVLNVNENKISLSMRALEAEEETQEEAVFDYKESGQATTGLGALLKGIKL